MRAPRPALALVLLAGCARAEADGPAATLAASGGSNPTVAVASDGTAYVAWAGGGEGGHDVRLARAGADGAWQAPVRVNDRPGDAAPHEQAPPQVAVGPGGEVYVAWPNAREVPGRRFPASDLRFAVSRDGGRTFSPAVTVNDDAGGTPSSHTFHDMAVGADGAVWVSWIDSRVRDAARAARPAPAVASASGATPTPAAKRAGHGGPSEAGLPGSELRVAVSRDGGRTFSPSRVVGGDVCPCCRTALAVTADGGAYVAWRKVFAGDVRDVVVSRLAADGTAAGPPVRVHADGWVYPGCPHAGAAVAVDGGGRVHVAWYTGREGRQGLWHASSRDGGRSFGEAEALLTGGWVPPSQVRLVADGDGVRAAWDDRRPKQPALRRGRIGPDGEVRDARAGGAGRSPDLAAGGGAALLAWAAGEAVRVRRLRD